MSVKSTIELTRVEAEDKYEAFKEFIQSEELTDEALCNLLTTMDDVLHDGESYNNYAINEEK